MASDLEAAQEKGSMMIEDAELRMNRSGMTIDRMKNLASDRNCKG